MILKIRKLTIEIQNRGVQKSCVQIIFKNVNEKLNLKFKYGEA